MPHTTKYLLMMSTIITSSNCMKLNHFCNKNFLVTRAHVCEHPGERIFASIFLAKLCTLNSHPLRLPQSVPVVCSVRRTQANDSSNSRSWKYVNCECWQEPTLSVPEWRISSSSDYHLFTALKQYRGDHKTGWILWHDGWYHGTRISMNRERETCPHTATNGSFVMRIMWKSTAVE